MRVSIAILALLLSHQIWAQPANDDCLGAISIPSTEGYCSGQREFSNVGATSDIINPQSEGDKGTVSCVTIDYDNGIWFSFRPIQPAVIIKINCDNPNGNCLSPQAVLFSGSCTTGLEYIDCTPGNSLEVSEFTVTGLTVNGRYYLYVENGVPGNFQICIDSYAPKPIPESDCDEAVVLCDKSPFQVENLNSTGTDNNEFAGFEDRCLREEFASSWYKWTCKDSGPLTFTLTPNNNRPGIEPDDLDFAVFELPGGIDDCDTKDMIRCMASGGCSDNFNEYIQCTGPTGLALSSTDIEEYPGCFGATCGSGSNPGTPAQNDDNFVSAINMVSGKSYALVVMNFSRTGQGFSMEFGGTGTFEGPEPDFEPMNFGNFLECDKSVEYFDNSDPGPDPIVEWLWNFGEGAMPLVETGIGPHTVVYESFGEKSVTLTVRTSRGCLVTKIIDIEIGPCCEDFAAPIVDYDEISNVCPGEENGAISYSATGPNPEFSYNVIGVTDGFLPNTQVTGLPSGTYEIIVQDIKGCLDTVEATITEPDPIFVDAGLDVEIELGSTDTLNATIDPPTPGVTYMWGSTDDLDCVGSDTLDCPNPIVVSADNPNCLDLVSNTYSVTITDENGCTDTDNVTVRANIVRPIYDPNVITPETNDINSEFILGFGRQAEIVLEFYIYDRWGNQIYKATDIEINNNNEMSEGWDGRFGKQSNRGTLRVDPGVYVWQAVVRFIDTKKKTFAGDVTVIR